MSWDDEEKDTSHWDEQKRQDFRSGDLSMDGSKSSFQCPNCGSWNTGQSTYSDWCNTCGESQGY